MTVQQRLRIVVPVLLLGAAVTWFVTRPSGDAGLLTASGTIEATEADLGFQLPGRVDLVTVREGDRVAADSLLAVLAQAELRARRAAAEAQVTAHQARLDELLAGFRPEEVAQARAAARAAEDRVENAGRDLERTRRLHDGGAVSREALDHQQTAYDLAVAEQDRAVEALRLLETGPRPEQIAAQRAALAQARAAVAQIDASLDQSVVRSPFAGIVTIRHRGPGEIASAGSPVLTLMDPDDRWVRIYLREDLVGRVSLGQSAQIAADAYPDRRYPGVVSYIASEAQFTPRNVQTTEERVRLVFEVRVRIVEDPSLDLKPGLAADVTLDLPGS